MRASSAWLPLAALILGLLGMHTAAARGDCSGGKLLRGGYGVIIYGITSAVGAESLSGVLVADGHCGLTGILSGNIAGTEMLSAAATGTYALGTDFTGTMTLAVAGAPAATYAVNWVVRHRQLVGVQNDGQGMAQVTAKEQQVRTFGPQTLAGKFSFLCFSPANLPAYLLAVTFDGVNAASATGWRYSGGTLVPWGPGHGAYAVTADGRYTLDLMDNAGNEYLFGGAIDSSGFNAPAAEIAENKSGAINGPSHCTVQQQ